MRRATRWSRRTPAARAGSPKPQAKGPRPTASTPRCSRGMGAVLELGATPARSESMREIRELHISRLGLIKDRTACRNRLQATRNRVVLAQLQARLRQVERPIEQIDAELGRLVTEDAALAHR